MADRDFGFTRTNPLSPWLPVCTGFFAAEITASILCTLPDPLHRFLPKLIARAVLYVLATVAAGIAGTLLPVWLTARHPQPATPVLARLSFAGWAFLPLIVLLYRQHSPLILLAVALASVPLGLSMQRLSTIADGLPITAPRSGNAWFGSLYGLPAPEYNPLAKFGIAAALAGAFWMAVNGFWAFASLSFAAAMFLGTWHWSTLTSHMRHRRRPGRRARVEMTATATFLTLLALVLWSVEGGRLTTGPIPKKPGAGATPPPAGGNHSAADYVGVILLPPKVEKKEIIAPAPRSPLHFGLGKPVVIPFDGPYWYFKAPARKPAREAHVAHGKSTEVNVHSSDIEPLMMEAHQALGSVVDLRCCAALDLKVLNADKRPGSIELGVVLSDSTAPGKPSLYLGELPLPSSQPLVIPHDRAPVEETLHFLIPSGAKSLRFNDITVVFHTAPFHARYGAKVAIQSFTLIPR